MASPSSLLEFLLEILVEVIEDKIDLLKAGMNQDWENFKKPVTVVGDVVRKITGQEVTEPAKKVKVK